MAATLGPPAPGRPFPERTGASPRAGRLLAKAKLRVILAGAASRWRRSLVVLPTESFDVV